MVVCKYFVNGNCRFGNKCYNEHPSGNSQGYAFSAQRQLFGGGGGNRGNRSGGGGNPYNKYKWTAQNNQSQQQTFAASATDVLSHLAGDMKEWGQSQMWPFSCVALDKVLPCIPEFEDTSFEELRHLAYEARKSGTFETYKQNVVQLAADFSRKRDMLINPSMSLKQTLNSLLEDFKRKSLSSNQARNAILTDNSAAMNTQSGGANPFGAATPGSGVLGASSISKPGTSLFSSGPEQAQQQTMFSQQPPSLSAFGNQSSGSAFGGPQPQTQATGLFGKPAPSAGISQNLFGKSQPTNGFAQSTSNPQFGAFSAASSDTGSSSAPAGFSNVGFGSTTGGFSGGSSTGFSSGGFSNSTASVANPQTVSMGSQALPKPVGTTSFSSNANSVYTDISELTAEELEAFRAPKFTLGRIPMRPPPLELC